MGNWYWYENWKRNQFETTIPEFYIVAISVMVYESFFETFFFVWCQYTIVRSLGGGGFSGGGRGASAGGSAKASSFSVAAAAASAARVPWWHVAKATVRSACFVSAIVMQFITLGQYFYPTSSARAFVNQGESLMLMVLLADSSYIREIVDRYAAQGWRADQQSAAAGVSTRQVG
ncbi:hypothetical protein DFJ73DRAFT_800207, partial [Zopfochytrium polystomum]